MHVDMIRTLRSMLLMITCIVVPLVSQSQSGGDEHVRAVSRQITSFVLETGVDSLLVVAEKNNRLNEIKTQVVASLAKNGRTVFDNEVGTGSLNGKFLVKIGSVHSDTTDEVKCQVEIANTASGKIIDSRLFTTDVASTGDASTSIGIFEIAESIVAIAGAVLIVYLFFTVRS